MKYKPTAQVKKKIENRINRSIDLFIDQIWFDQYNIVLINTNLSIGKKIEKRKIVRNIDKQNSMFLTKKKKILF